MSDTTNDQDPIPSGVTARFYVEAVTRRAYNPKQADVVLQAAGRGEQNRAWAEASPSGKFEIHVTIPRVADFFETHLGHDLEFTMRPVDDGRFVSPHSPTPVDED